MWNPGSKELALELEEKGYGLDQRCKFDSEQPQFDFHPKILTHRYAYKAS